jgi:hypothetical protein
MGQTATIRPTDHRDTPEPAVAPAPLAVRAAARPSLPGEMDRLVAVLGQAVARKDGRDGDQSRPGA